MKCKHKQMYRSILSIVLVLSLVLGSATNIFAAISDETNKINYVSFGDSMANGYGLAGYNETNEYGEFGVNGYLQNDTNAYPAQFAKYLEETTGADVNHTQLAISCLRAEDLRFALELDYRDPDVIQFIDKIHNGGTVGYDYSDIEAEWDALDLAGDKFTYDEFVDGRFGDWADAKHKDAKGEEYTTLDYAEQFQVATADADIITIGSGNANFGVFLLHRLVDAVGVFGKNESSYEWVNVEDAMDDLDEESRVYAMEIYNELKAQISGDAPEMVEDVVELVTYTTVSYMLNYKGVLDRIVELNDHADIMIVGLMNAMEGMVLEFYKTDADGNKVVDGNGKPIVEYTLDIGGLMATTMKGLNNYLAGLATVMSMADKGKYGAHNFYIAEAEGLTKADMIYDELETAANAGWDPSKGYDIVRDRIVSEYNDTIFGMVEAMFNDMVRDYGLKLEKVSIENVKAYEQFAKDWAEAGTEASTTLSANQIISCAVYLAFEDATIEGSKLDVLDGNAFLEMANGLDGIFDNVAENLVLDLSTISANVTDAVMADIMANDADEIKAWVMTHETYGPEITEKVEDWVMDNCTVQEIMGAMSSEDPTLAFMNLAASFINDVIVPEYLAKPEVQKYITDNYAPKYITDNTAKYLAADLGPALSDALTSDTTLLGLFNLFARFLVGNGIGCHPSQTGHNKLADEVIKTYAEGYTVQEETIENLIYIIANYHDVIYDYIFDYAESEGHFDADAIKIQKSDDNYYVALGDSTAYAFDEDKNKKNDVTPYGDRLAEELGLSEEQYKNLSKDGMTAAELCKTIETNKADIEKADIVSLSLGNGEIIQFVIEQITAEEPEAIDWSKITEQDVAGEIENTLAEIEKKITGSMDQQTADMVMLALESYVYRYIELVCTYPEAINAIHAINPDVQVAIVGMYNPLEDAVLSIDGMDKIEIGEYLDYIIQLSNVHYLAYVMMTENTVYVDAPAVENGIDKKELNLKGLLNILRNQHYLYPTNAGHEYIKEQIMKMTTVVETPANVLWGDADGNGVVNTYDASVILQYCSELIIAEDMNYKYCDVDGNGVVNTYDASLVLQHCSELIDLFPVEE